MLPLLDELLRVRNELERVTSTWSRGVFPSINIYDNGEMFMVRAEMAGIDRNSIDVTAKVNQLTIRGERCIKPADEEAAYHRRERDAGQFRRTITLPDHVDAGKIQATYRNGVLEVTVPRAPEAKPRRIEVA